MQLAYSAGKPVVATDTGGLSEVVEHGRSGLLVPSRNVGALAKAIARIIENSQQRESMGRYAKSLALTKYSWAKIAAKTVGLYESSVTR